MAQQAPGPGQGQGQGDYWNKEVSKMNMNQGAAAGGGGGYMAAVVPVPQTVASPIMYQPQPATRIYVTSPAPQTHESQRMFCPSCSAEITTTVERETGAFTHLCALGLCCIACWPCCLCPYCVDDCKDSVHTCPNCKAVVGLVKRL